MSNSNATQVNGRDIERVLRNYQPILPATMLVILEWCTSKHGEEEIKKNPKHWNKMFTAKGIPFQYTEIKDAQPN